MLQSFEMTLKLVKCGRKKKQFLVPRKAKSEEKVQKIQEKHI